MWRPPAATVAILTPILRVTRHGNAERLSSLEVELSAGCFPADTLLLLELSSLLPLPSEPDTVLPINLEVWGRGLVVNNESTVNYNCYQLN